MEMPTITDGHRKLERLVGSWSGTEKLYPTPWDPKGGTANARVQNKSALDGFAVIQDYEQERDGKVNFKGHGIFNVDPAGQEFAMHWFDSMGMPGSIFKGTFEGDVLTLNTAGSQGHSRATFDFRTPGSYHFKMEVSQDGKSWFPFMEGNYRRA